MDREFNLSEKREPQVIMGKEGYSYIYPEENVKEKIQNAQRRLKEEIDERNIKQFFKDLIKEIIDKIFKEEFGEKLLKK